MTDDTFPPGPVLMVVEATVEPDREQEFNRWYDEEHLPQCVGCPGFIRGARYRSTDDQGPKYLAVYLLEDESAIESPELAAIRGFGRLDPYVTYERRLYRPIADYKKGAAATVPMGRAG